MSFRASSRLPVVRALESTVFLLLATAAFAQAPDSVTHEALWLMPRVGAPAPSPDGKWVVFPVVQPAYEEHPEFGSLYCPGGRQSASAPAHVDEGCGKRRGLESRQPAHRVCHAAGR